MKPRQPHTLTCPGCGSTVTAPTKKQAVAEAVALGWYHVNTRPVCRACELAEVARRAVAWKPGEPSPF